jgi:hypothetical protein
VNSALWLTNFCSTCIWLSVNSTFLCLQPAVTSCRFWSYFVLMCDFSDSAVNEWTGKTCLRRFYTYFNAKNYGHWLYSSLNSIFSALIVPISLPSRPTYKPGIFKYFIRSVIGVTINGFRMGWLDLLHLYTQLVTTSNRAVSLISTLHNSLLHPLMSSVKYRFH